MKWATGENFVPAVNQPQTACQSEDLAAEPQLKKKASRVRRRGDFIGSRDIWSQR